MRLTGVAKYFLGRAMQSFGFPDARSKQPKSGADLILAAADTQHELVVATGNIEHFRRIHARYKLPGLYNPLLDQWTVKHNPSHSPLAL
jgi:hypothetical protein